MRTEELLLAPRDEDLGEYQRAFVDWVGCAVGGRAGAPVPPASATLTAAEDVVALGSAGHYLDFDDTYLPGMGHISSPIAPAVVVAGMRVEASVDEMVKAFAHGFEASAALGRATSPQLYERGWHATTVCGPFGAAVAAAMLLPDADPLTASRLGLTAAGGTQGTFGTQAKSIQVGLAAATGFQAASASSTAVLDDASLSGDRGFLELYAGGGNPAPLEPGIRDNWLKAYPCCLQTHTTVEAALELRERGIDLRPDDKVQLRLSPMARRAASYDRPRTELEAKFSPSYVFLLSYLHGGPKVTSFDPVDNELAGRAGAVEVVVDPDLTEPVTEVISPNGAFEALRIETALGSPARPMSDDQLDTKTQDLTGQPLLSWLRSSSRTAEELRSVLA